MIHYAFPPDPVETHYVVEAEALQLSAATINQVLNSIVKHAVPSVNDRRERRQTRSRDPGRDSRACARRAPRPELLGTRRGCGANPLQGEYARRRHVVISEDLSGSSTILG